LPANDPILDIGFECVRAIIVLNMRGVAEAQRLLESALRKAREAAEPSLVAHACGLLGGVLWNTGDPRRAEILIREQISIRSNLGHHEGLYAGNHALSFTLATLGDRKGAAAAAELCLEIARRDGDPDGVASAQWRLSWLRLETGEFESAQAALAEAVSLRRRLGDRRGVAQALELRAEIELRALKLESADAASSEAMQLYEETDDQWSLASLLHGGATDLALCRGQLEAAETQCRRAHQMTTSLGSPWVRTWVDLKLALVLGERGELEAAEQLVQESLAQAEQTGSIALMSRTHAYVAEVLSRCGKHKDATTHAQSGVVMARDVGATEVEIALFALATVEYRSGNHAASVRAAEEGLALCMSSGSSLAADYLLILGRAETARGGYGVAANHLLEAVERLWANGALRLLVDTLVCAARLLALVGRQDEASILHTFVELQCEQSGYKPENDVLRELADVRARLAATGSRPAVSELDVDVVIQTTTAALTAVGESGQGRRSGRVDD
jgi:tetratricopeptide (TPR) repeat protein